jgi:NaMN:DMB phosphoribosyltransferase
MTAVVALMTAYLATRREMLATERLAVATTRWVAFDPRADLAGLAAQAGPTPVLAANLDFSSSRHAGLRRYEEWLVKEGVGAGGAALAALLAGVSLERHHQEIDTVVDELDLPAATG